VDLDIDATRRTVTEEARLLRCTATTYEPHLQRADARLLYDRFDQRALAERLVTGFASHIYFPAELELLFLSAGFEIAQQYGDYRFVRFDRTSPYVVTVARRPRRSGRRPGRLSENDDCDRTVGMSRSSRRSRLHSTDLACAYTGPVSRRTLLRR